MKSNVMRHMMLKKKSNMISGGPRYNIQLISDHLLNEYYTHHHSNRTDLENFTINISAYQCHNICLLIYLLPIYLSTFFYKSSYCSLILSIIELSLCYPTITNYLSIILFYFLFYSYFCLSTNVYTSLHCYLSFAIIYCLSKYISIKF